MHPTNSWFKLTYSKMDFTGMHKYTNSELFQAEFRELQTFWLVDTVASLQHSLPLAVQRAL